MSIIRALLIGSLLCLSAAPVAAQDATAAIEASEFGDNSAFAADNGVCDDPRFVGAGMSEAPSTLAETHDAADCSAAYEAGTIDFAETDRSLHPEGPLSILLRLKTISEGGGKIVELN